MRKELVGSLVSWLAG